jgi:surface antigen
MTRTSPLHKRASRARTLAMSLCALLALPALSAPALADPHWHRHRMVEVHHHYPPHYHHVFVPREHFYHGVRIWRPYGPHYAGFGYYYDDAAAAAFLGLTAFTLADYAALDEAQMRAHEEAMVEAASAPVDEPIEWSDGGASGSVTTVRDGHTSDGRACREFQQKVTVGGKTENAYGTACQEPDGSWKIVADQQ